MSDEKVGACGCCGCLVIVIVLFIVLPIGGCVRSAGGTDLMGLINGIVEGIGGFILLAGIGLMFLFTIFFGMSSK